MTAPRSLLFALALAACVRRAPPPDLTEQDSLEAAQAQFRLEFSGADRESERDVKAALVAAVPVIRRWGPLEEPVTVKVFPDHAGLEDAVSLFDYPWLRAWARYKTIFLQSPRSWGLLGGSQPQITELLTHELTHCLMYQLAATEKNWADKQIPLWFSEGMASVTASQGYRRPSPEELLRFMRDHPGEDPIGNAESLYQNQSEIVYGAAHRAFQFLLERYGEARIKRMFARMKAGALFGEAFAREIGVSPSDFERDFLNYLRWGGWRPVTRTGS